MGNLRYSINLTLDGCCDHQTISPDEELHHHAARNIGEADALLFGRITYEMMETAWRPLAESGVKSDWMEDWMLPFAKSIHTAKKYIVSNSLQQVNWNAEIIRGEELKKTVEQLKKDSSRYLFTGGVKLPLALAELGLIDEYEFIVHPRIVGHGPHLFAGLLKYVDLKLVSQKEFGSGAVALQYILKK